MWIYISICFFCYLVLVRTHYFTLNEYTDIYKVCGVICSGNPKSNTGRPKQERSHINVEKYLIPHKTIPGVSTRKPSYNPLWRWKSAWTSLKIVIKDYLPSLIAILNNVNIVLIATSCIILPELCTSTYTYEDVSENKHCPQWKRQLQRNPQFSNNVVTCDESRFYHYNPELKPQSIQ